MRSLLRYFRLHRLHQLRAARRKRDRETLLRRLAESPYQSLSLADGRTVELRRVTFMLRNGVLHELPTKETT